MKKKAITQAIKVALSASAVLLTSCSMTDSSTQTSSKNDNSYYGTLEPFAQENVYFVLTDRFVDGDPNNNYPEQGGEVNYTFNRPLKGPDGKEANVGYMGGDLLGVYQQADYIKDLGFTSVWITPIVDNPDEAFTGGEVIEFGGMFKDGGKTGYHGYWGVNFFVEDEHVVSDNFKFKDYTKAMKNKGIKTVLDIVANHGSPAYTMPVDQPKYGEIYDKNGKLIADHKNKHPTELDHNDPLEHFYKQKPDLAQLSDTNYDNPAVLEYFVEAYLQWVDQGADAFRIDTIRHMPHFFWKKFADRIREERPDFFMFGESFVYDANFIAQHTLPENGKVSVLDFPGQEAITGVFGKPKEGESEKAYSDILSYLYLEQSPYHNPYDLMTFYDNHDMARMNADDNGFINANNWIFTSRGIPVIYYGSETAFMAGTAEHGGNRNYYGIERVKQAANHPVAQSMKKIANLRLSSVALQRGLQLNLEFAQDTASFYRIYQHDGVIENALVLLNKSDSAKTVNLSDSLHQGSYKDAFSGEVVNVGSSLSYSVPANGVVVLINNTPITDAGIKAKLNKLKAVVPSA